MLTDANIISNLKTILNRDRSIAVQKFIEKLLVRSVTSSLYGTYRVKDTNTNSDITNITDFINNITDCTISYNFNAKVVTEGNIQHSFLIKVDNYEVNLTDRSDEDLFFYRTYGTGNTKKIVFICVSDMVNNLPEGFTVIDVKLI